MKFMKKESAFETSNQIVYTKTKENWNEIKSFTFGLFFTNQIMIFFLEKVLKDHKNLFISIYICKSHFPGTRRAHNFDKF